MNAPGRNGSVSGSLAMILFDSIEISRRSAHYLYERNLIVESILSLGKCLMRVMNIKLMGCYSGDRHDRLNRLCMLKVIVLSVCLNW